jgi:hypothetical protein
VPERKIHVPERKTRVPERKTRVPERKTRAGVGASLAFVYACSAFVYVRASAVADERRVPGDGLLVGQQRDLVDDHAQARGVVRGVVPVLGEHRVE